MIYLIILAYFQHIFSVSFFMPNIPLFEWSSLVTDHMKLFLPQDIHKKLKLFLLIWQLPILPFIQHQSPHSPAFGRSTWSFSHSSKVLTDLSNSVGSANLSLFTFFSRSYTMPPRMGSESRVKCRMAFTQNVHYCPHVEPT